MSLRCRWQRRLRARCQRTERLASRESAPCPPQLPPVGALLRRWRPLPISRALALPPRWRGLRWRCGDLLRIDRGFEARSIAPQHRLVSRNCGSRVLPLPSVARLQPLARGVTAGSPGGIDGSQRRSDPFRSDVIQHTRGGGVRRREGTGVTGGKKKEEITGSCF